MGHGSVVCLRWRQEASPPICNENDQPSAVVLRRLGSTVERTDRPSRSRGNGSRAAHPRGIRDVERDGSRAA